MDTTAGYAAVAAISTASGKGITAKAVPEVVKAASSSAVISLMSIVWHDSLVVYASRGPAAAAVRPSLTRAVLSSGDACVPLICMSSLSGRR